MTANRTGPHARKEAVPNDARPLAPRVYAVLDSVRVHADGLSAAVRGERVTATSPRALESRLANAIYQMMHVGRRSPDADPAPPALDRALEESLVRAVPHEFTHYPAPVLTVDGRQAVVRIAGVRVRLDRDRITIGSAETAETAKTAAASQAGWAGEDDAVRIGHLASVRVAAVRPRLTPGFLLADGSRPLTGDSPVLRMYVHVPSPGVAVDVWGTALRYLEEEALPYRAKVISSGGQFPRQDALVVYLGSRAQKGLPGLIRAVGSVEGVGTGTPCFALPVAPGVALAWEPEDPRPGMRRISLGEHRSRVMATALVRSAVPTGDHPSADGPADVVRKALTEANIDPTEPARNLSSPPFFPRPDEKQRPF
ncbi:T3SS effector HopA1 family protein [Streptomyces sp. NPDC058239]|uniref:T3SS effector HopA1 family protein n=1 Tax=unclassified Streptomyces TaxID=2593676 RepID=UPI00365CCCCA